MYWLHLCTQKRNKIYISLLISLCIESNTQRRQTSFEFSLKTMSVTVKTNLFIHSQWTRFGYTHFYGNFNILTLNTTYWCTSSKCINTPQKQIACSYPITLYRKAPLWFSTFLCIIDHVIKLLPLTVKHSLNWYVHSSKCNRVEYTPQAHTKWSQSCENAYLQ